MFLLLSEGQTGEAWATSNEAFFFPIVKAREKNNFTS
jgi:hypothetical protein